MRVGEGTPMFVYSVIELALVIIIVNKQRLIYISCSRNGLYWTYSADLKFPSQKFPSQKFPSQKFPNTSIAQVACLLAQTCKGCMSFCWDEIERGCPFN